jgi:hypothetical protein
MPSSYRGREEVQIYPSFKLGARWGCVVNVTPRSLYPRARDPLPIVQEARQAPRVGLDQVKNLAPNRI